MAFGSELNKILLVDGVLFIIPGLSMFTKPSAHRKLKEKPESKVAAPALRDLQRATGASYISMGVFVVLLGYSVNNASELENIAIYRAISLLFIIMSGVLQISAKRWKISGTQIMYVMLYSLLLLTYIYFGIVDPM